MNTNDTNTYDLGRQPRLVPPGGDPHAVPEPAGERRRDGGAGRHRYGAGRAGTDRRRDPASRTRDGLTGDLSTLNDNFDGLGGVQYSYQWLRVDPDGSSNETEITGEIASTYTLTTADVGKKIKVKVSFTDDLNGVEERTSAAYPAAGVVTAVGVATAQIQMVPAGWALKPADIGVGEQFRLMFATSTTRKRALDQ